MPFTGSAALAARLKRELPPAAPLPAVLQTLGCRWWPFGYTEWCRARYGDRFTVYPVDMAPLVFLSDPQDIRAIVTAPADVLHPGIGSTVIAPIIGERSFVLHEEDEHMNGRKAITPAFHQQVVQEHADMVTEIARREIRAWPLDRTFPIHPYIRTLTLRVILRTVFSGESHLQRELHKRLLDMLSVAASLVLQEPRLRYLPGWHATWKRFVKQRAEADELIFALIDRRRREGDGRGDLLDMQLAARNLDGSPLSERQLRDNLMSMLLVGHETTTAQLAWAFQLLAHNRIAQDRLIEEIDGGTSAEYLAATVLETMRHKSVFLFMIPRAVVRPIEIGGWTYKPPVSLVGCTYLMHHDPGLYPDPHAFRPERFLGKAPQAGTWLPWGAGRKRCIGRHFALMEMQTVLREVLATRVVLPASARIEHPRWRSVILTPHAGSRIILGVRRRRPEPSTPLLTGATV